MCRLSVPFVDVPVVRLCFGVRLTDCMGSPAVGEHTLLVAYRVPFHSLLSYSKDQKGRSLFSRLQQVTSCSKRGKSVSVFLSLLIGNDYSASGRQEMRKGLFTTRPGMESQVLETERPPSGRHEKRKNERTDMSVEEMRDEVHENMKKKRKRNPAA